MRLDGENQEFKSEHNGLYNSPWDPQTKILKIFLEWSRVTRDGESGRAANDSDRAFMAGAIPPATFQKQFMTFNEEVQDKSRPRVMIVNVWIDGAVGAE